jgi:hypothetical protein
MPSLLRLRALPWLLLFEAARSVHSHVNENLSPRERRRVAEILRGSRGLPQNISRSDRDELKRIAKKLDPGQLARDIGPQLLRAGAGRRRRR